VEATIGEFELIHEDDDRFFIIPDHPAWTVSVTNRPNVTKT